MPMELVPHDLDFDYLSKRRVCIAASLILILLGVVATIVRGGPPVGIDFAGGTEVQLRFDAGVSADESRLRDVARGAGFEDATVVRFGEADASEFLIKFKGEPVSTSAAGSAGNADEEGGLAANARVARLEDTIREQIGGFTEQRVEYVGPKVGEDLRRDGMNALLMSAVAILIYVAFRFSSRYAPGAVVALVHDVLVTSSLLVMANFFFRIEFDLQILAALLAIVGYSLNDTIIIYDRIRENLELHPASDLEAVLNLSVNQTMSRTVLTSGTTMLAVIALLTFGGEVIFPFSFTMAIGIVVGTYSSIFIAAPVLLYLERRYGNPKTPSAGAVARRGAAVGRARA
ncbi:MAG: protein translocase subunit SecF [Deltaproteobacteria bacterium]|nr:protein translocase subunit SecF [Deltaproteobacteria bacterium]